MRLTERKSRRLPISKRIATSVREHAARSHMFKAVLGLLRTRIVPSFLVNRAVANGLIREELESALKLVRNWEELPQVLAGIAEDLYEKGRYWDELGLKSRACDHYLDSSLWGFYAQLLLTDSAEQRWAVYAKCAHSYRMAAPHFHHPAQQISIALQSGSLKGYLRLPGRQAGQAVRPSPCVIILNNLASSKEELHFTENAFLKMGLATLSLDLPGCGESLDTSLQSANIEVLGNAVYLFLASHPAVDQESLALHGISLGGSLALYLAIKFPGRFKAIATLSAPYDLAANPILFLPAFRRELACLTRGREEVIREYARKTAVRGWLDEISCPILVAGGGKDIVIPPPDTRIIYQKSGVSDKKLLYCPQAGHCCYEMMPSLRYEIAQWIRQRI